MPSPYTSCLMVCPSCITCTTSSLTALTAVPRLGKRSNLFRRGARRHQAPRFNRLEACDVLRLKALRALLYFKLHRLAFIEGLVAVHHDGGEVYEDIFSGLALDEPVALRSIEPLHCSLFLHFRTSHTMTPR